MLLTSITDVRAYAAEAIYPSKPLYMVYVSSAERGWATL